MKLLTFVCLALIEASLGFSPQAFGYRGMTQLRSEPPSFMPDNYVPSSESIEYKDGAQYLEFTIYPDGRVEERVIGIKGEDCLKVTENINKALGQVISTQPTEEAFQQELVVDETIAETVSEWESQGEGETPSWEGSSQW